MDNKPIDKPISLDYKSLTPKLSAPLFKALYSLSLQERRQLIKQWLPLIDISKLNSGGIDAQKADLMVQNCIGKLALPLGLATGFVINSSRYVIPMVIEQPSVIAAASSVGKFIGESGGFRTHSKQSVAIGQIQMIGMENLDSFQYQILSLKPYLIQLCNEKLKSLTSRGGGLREIRVKKLTKSEDKTFYKPLSMAVVEVLVDVREAMGANIVNTLCQQLGLIIQDLLKVRFGLRILTNYCTQRMSYASFEIPIRKMMWKGIQIAHRILEAQDFAHRSVHRATTHNKGIMNGIDAVLIATGQDWRAVEAACHTHASRNGSYQPLTNYQIIQRNGQKIFKGSLQLPISVGTVGGAIEKNKLYQQNLQMMGSPTSRELAEITACVGLAQNFGALRALVVEGIQEGHMRLHLRTKTKL